MERAPVKGSGKGAGGWFALTGTNVAYDHPVHAYLEHAVLIDFVNPELGPAARVAVELSPDSALALVDAIHAALARGAIEHTELAGLAAPAR
jgi:hypothetical protein